MSLFGPPRCPCDQFTDVCEDGFQYCTKCNKAYKPAVPPVPPSTLQPHEWVVEREYDIKIMSNNATQTMRLLRCKRCGVNVSFNVTAGCYTDGMQKEIVLKGTCPAK